MSSASPHKMQLPVLDIYLFFNPIDPLCYDCINNVTEMTEQLGYKHYLHIIPYQNFRLIANYIRAHHLDEHDIVLQNSIQAQSYAIATMYKAANFQGKKKARRFLQELNSFTQLYHHHITENMLLQAAQKADLDLTMLVNDRNSDNVKQLYRLDQQMATRFKIEETPSIIIFDSLRSNGILLDTNVSLDRLALDLTMRHYIAEV